MTPNDNDSPTNPNPLPPEVEAVLNSFVDHIMGGKGSGSCNCPNCRAKRHPSGVGFGLREPASGGTADGPDDPAILTAFSSLLSDLTRANPTEPFLGPGARGGTIEKNNAMITSLFFPFFTLYPYAATHRTLIARVNRILIDNGESNLAKYLTSCIFIAETLFLGTRIADAKPLAVRDMLIASLESIIKLGIDNNKPDANSSNNVYAQCLALARACTLPPHTFGFSLGSVFW